MSIKVRVLHEIGGPKDEGQRIAFESHKQVIVDIDFPIRDGKVETFSLDARPSGEITLLHFKGGQGKVLWDRRMMGKATIKETIEKAIPHRDNGPFAWYDGFIAGLEVAIGEAKLPWE